MFSVDPKVFDRDLGLSSDIFLIYLCSSAHSGRDDIRDKVNWVQKGNDVIGYALQLRNCKVPIMSHLSSFFLSKKAWDTPRLLKENGP